MKYRDFTNYEVYPYEDKIVNLKSGKELKQSTNDRGYKCYRLYKDGKVFSIRTNRLYYECVNGEIPKGMEIDHIDNNRENNNPSNLRAVSHTDNINNPISLKVRKEVLSSEEYRAKRSAIMKGKYSGEKNPMYGRPRPEGASVPPKPIKVFKDGELVAIYPCINEAARDLNLSRGNITSCLKGIRTHTKGYTFELC